MYFRNYEIQMVKFIRNLEKITPTIIDENIRKQTFNSLLNYSGQILLKKCTVCEIQLVDPVGLKIIKENKYLRHARCAGCGYSGFAPYL